MMETKNINVEITGFTGKPSPAVSVPDPVTEHDTADYLAHSNTTPKQAWALGWNQCREQMLYTPTPPSAEQLIPMEKDKAKNWDYYQELLKSHGFSGITDLLTKYHTLERSIEQPDRGETR